MLAIATDKTLSLIASPGSAKQQPDATENHPWGWSEIELSANQLTFSADNLWFACVCEYGGIWFNRREDNRWIYLSTGLTGISFGYFSADGHRFIATDSGGRALIVDMTASI